VNAAGEVVYTTYGGLGRPLITGTATGVADFGAVTETAVAGYPSAQPGSRRHLRVYDAAPSGAPWTDGGSVPALANTAGRLAAEAYRGAGGAAWRVTFYSYNAQGQVAEKTVDAPGLSRQEFRYAYDRQGRLTGRQADAAGMRFCQWYTYNARGLLREVYADAAGSCTATTRSATVPEATYTYTADGQVESVDYRDGHGALPYAYDRRGRLTSIGDVENNTSPFSARYSYFQNGTVDEAQFRQPGTAHPHLLYRYRHTYDRLSRIESAAYDYDAGGWQTSAAYGTQYSYDRNGNLETLVRSDGSGAVIDDLDYYSADEADPAKSPNRMIGVHDRSGTTLGWDAASASASAIAYDANGNLTKYAADPYSLTGITYDERNLPTSVTAGGQAVTYRYSAAGQRTYKKVGSQAAEHYLLDGAATVGVVEGGSVRFANLLTPDGRVIGRYTANLDRRYYYTDHLGSTRAVVDGSGTAQETRDYYPFGLRMPDRTLAEASSAKEDYTGHERDAETSLHYAGARYYMSALGRWTSVDPILGEKSPLDLVTLQSGRLHTFSPYSYVYNNPTTLVDPDGKTPILGAIIGAGADYGTQVAMNLAQRKGWVEAFTDVDGGSIAVSAAAGAASSGLSVVLRSQRALRVVQVAGEVAVDAAASTTNQALSNGEVDGLSVAADVVLGQSIGRAVSSIAGRRLANSRRGGELRNQADRADRIADNSDVGRPEARQRQADAARQQYDAYTVGRAAGAGSAAAGVGSKILNEAEKDPEFDEKR